MIHGAVLKLEFELRLAPVRARPESRFSPARKHTAVRRLSLAAHRPAGRCPIHLQRPPVPRNPVLEPRFAAVARDVLRRPHTLVLVLPLALAVFGAADSVQAQPFRVEEDRRRRPLRGAPVNLRPRPAALARHLSSHQQPRLTPAGSVAHARVILRPERGVDRRAEAARMRGKAEGGLHRPDQHVGVREKLEVQQPALHVCVVAIAARGAVVQPHHRHAARRRQAREHVLGMRVIVCRDEHHRLCCTLRLSQ
eukprot:742116-Rhodomonas_salina.1